ncbi:hypothetical protein, partial [Corynebacterium glutamicum]|uniref:hypothetical protein n=1 Tax=Corynebacterium glutamicum TaxID=1718 RepID=UPI001A7E1BAE
QAGCQEFDSPMLHSFPGSSCLRWAGIFVFLVSLGYLGGTPVALWVIGKLCVLSTTRFGQNGGQN